MYVAQTSSVVQLITQHAWRDLLFVEKIINKILHPTKLLSGWVGPHRRCRRRTESCLSLAAIPRACPRRCRWQGAQTSVSCLARPAQLSVWLTCDRSVTQRSHHAHRRALTLTTHHSHTTSASGAQQTTSTINVNDQHGNVPCPAFSTLCPRRQRCAIGMPDAV